MSIEWPELHHACVAFIQQLIQTPSMPGEEKQLSDLVAARLRHLGFDEVRQDALGNVIGTVYGADRSLAPLLLNTHLDHVDPGDPSLWPHPPYGGVIADGRVIGRGASDIKGPLATQVFALAGLLQAGERPRRDVVLTAVVEEEIGGTGAIHMAQTLPLKPALIVIGEPSSNDVSIGHRGIQQLWVTFHGRSAHASAPEKAVNPNYALARFLARLDGEKGTLAEHPRLGRTTVQPTVIEVDTRSRNVSPAWARVCLDFRTAIESVATLQTFIERIAGGDKVTITNALEMADHQPLPADRTPIVGYDTDPATPAVARAIDILSEGMGRSPAIVSYQFATDGRHFLGYDAPIIGYAPGDEREAHTAGEGIAVAQVLEALRGYVALLRTY